MPIKFRCTCGKAYQVSDKHAGRKITCKGCGKTLRVPGGAPVPSAAASDEFEFADDAVPARSVGGTAPPPLVNVKRKRSRQDPEKDARQSRDPSRNKKIVLIAGLALFGLLGVAGVGFVVKTSMNAEQAPKAPQEYVEYKSDQGGFKADCPADWESDGRGGTGGVPPWARFKDGTASISIKASLSGTAISDIAGASQPAFGEDVDDDDKPIARVHEFQHDKIAHKYSDYEEQPGHNEQIPWGEVRISEFTASEGSFGSKIRGYRITMTSVQWQFNVICKCPKRKWEQYQPIFDHVIKSIDH